MSYDELHAMIDAPRTEGGLLLAQLEDTLTAGYARALALEAERLRVERRIAEVAAKLADGDSDLRREELAKLAERLTSTDRDLTRLRTVLAALKVRAREERQAAR